MPFLTCLIKKETATLNEFIRKSLEDEIEPKAAGIFLSAIIEDFLDQSIPGIRIRRFKPAFLRTLREEFKFDAAYHTGRLLDYPEQKETTMISLTIFKDGKHWLYIT
ncbi:MAG: hypothetical protein AAB922_06670 [Patescibacteria group bacterium]